MASDIFETIELEDLPEDFRLMAEIVGMKIARVLIRDLGGIRIYVPSHRRLGPLVERYIRQRYIVDESGRSNVLELASELGMTPDFVRRVARPRRARVIR